MKGTPVVKSRFFLVLMGLALVGSPVFSAQQSRADLEVFECDGGCVLSCTQINDPSADCLELCCDEMPGEGGGCIGVSCRT